MSAQHSGPIRDAVAAAAFYDAWFPRVYAYFARRTADAATAEDLAAETFERIVGALPAFRPIGDAEIVTRAWVYRIAANVYKNALRGRDRRLAREAGWRARWGDAADLRADLETRLALGQALALLPAEDRDLLGLRFWEGLTAREIAEVRDCGPREVYTAIDRCLRQLRRQLAAGRPSFDELRGAPELKELNDARFG
jgi:RNA polymerase sigma-70 factor (ECF subfamily)